MMCKHYINDEDDLRLQYFNPVNVFEPKCFYEILRMCFEEFYVHIIVMMMMNIYTHTITNQGLPVIQSKLFKLNPHEFIVFCC